MAEESAKQAAELTTLDKILTEGKMVRDESQKSYAKDLIGEFVNQVLDQGMTIGADTFASINKRIAQIDELISKQLNDALRPQRIDEELDQSLPVDEIAERPCEREVDDQRDAALPERTCLRP